MRKVAFFIPTLNFGGIEANTIRLAKAFIKQGYDVDLLVVRLEGDYIERLPSEINVIDLSCAKVYKAIPFLKRYINLHKPDAIISGGEAPNIVLIISKLLTFKNKAKIVVSIRTHLSTELRKTNSINLKILKYMGKLFYHFADEIVAVSRGVAEDASKIFGLNREKINVIYNPVFDEDLIDKDPYRTKQKLEVAKIPTVIGVGRLVQQKNFALLINSFSVVLKQKQAKLIILGEGPERLNLEQQIKLLKLDEDVELLGYQDNPYQHMKESDIFVLSSEWEGFGNVIVEAMACGLKIVSTDCPSGPAEILDDGEFGVLVKNNNVTGLAKGILEAISTKNDLNKGLNRAKHFSAESARQKYERLIYSDN